MRTIYGDYFLESDFDSDVLQLIQDLGLVFKASPQYLYWLSVIACSHYYKYHFCDRYRDFLSARDRQRHILCSELYKTYRPYSRRKLNAIESCAQDRLL